MVACQLKSQQNWSVVYPWRYISHQDFVISLDNIEIIPSDSLRDNQLFFLPHITKLTQSCRFPLYNTRGIWPFLSWGHSSACSILSSWDWTTGWSASACYPTLATEPVFSCQTCFQPPKEEPSVYSLHWLPADAHIRFKTLMHEYKAKNGQAPTDFKALITPCFATCSLWGSSMAWLDAACFKVEGWQDSSLSWHPGAGMNFFWLSSQPSHWSP